MMRGFEGVEGALGCGYEVDFIPAPIHLNPFDF